MKTPVLFSVALPMLFAAGASYADTFVFPLEAASDSIQIYEVLPDSSIELRATTGKERLVTSSGTFINVFTESFLDQSNSVYVYDSTTGVGLTKSNDQQLITPEALRGSNNVWSFAVPNSRAGHVFSVVGGEGYYTVISSGPVGRWIPDGNGYNQWEDWGFFNVRGTPDANSAPHLLDITDHESWGQGVTDGTIWSASSDSAVPIANVKVIFPDQVSTYTLHTSTGALQSLTPLLDDENHFFANGAVAWQETYWITRDIDDAQSGEYSSPSDTTADIRSSMQPYLAHYWVTHSFRIGQNRFGHDLSIRFEDGDERTLNWDWPLNSMGDSFLTYWEDNGSASYYYYSYYLGEVDEDQPSWTVHDYTTGEDLGMSYDIFTDYNPTNHLTTPALGGFSLPSTRRTHPLRLLQPNGEAWDVDMSSAWDSSSWDYAFVGTPLETDYQLLYFDVYTPYNPQFEFQIFDPITGDYSPTVTATSNPHDLAYWYTPGAPVEITMSESRWSNTLVLVQPYFQETISSKSNLVGAYSYTENGNGPLTFSSDGYFTLTPNVHSEVPWAIWDATRMQYLVPDQGTTTSFLNAYDDTDSDGDGIPDWWEKAQGLNHLSADTDGDGMSDADELRLGRDPKHAAQDGTGYITLELHTPTLR